MDKNTYIILGAAAGILMKEGRDAEAAQMYDRVQKLQDDQKVLQIIGEYVETEKIMLDPEMQMKKEQLLDSIQRNKTKGKNSRSAEKKG